jgi:hypothetical protein
MTSPSGARPPLTGTIATAPRRPSPPTALPTASPTTTPGRSAPSRPADTFRQRLDRRQAAHDTLNLLRDNDSERAVALREQLLQIEDRARGLDEHTIGHEL